MKSWVFSGILWMVGALIGCSAVMAQDSREAPHESAARVRSPNFPTPWWTSGISQQPQSWYRTEEARRIAENILSWQHENGGWPLMNTTREPNRGDPAQAGPWGTRGALVGSTVNEIRFLARAYAATQKQTYMDALRRGLEFILKAQYPAGGWPKSYPPQPGGYAHYATFNDNEMTSLMTLLREVADGGDFEILDPKDRARADSAYDKGIEFILKCQIVVDRVPTAWAQQHDEQTFEPRPARTFEPAAITGGESAGIVNLLMDVPHPSPEVVRAIEAAVQWYRDSEILGIDVVREDGDVVVRPNPDAPPRWARFYEIGTNRPIFAGRDGVIRYSLAEIDHERRTGYSWYNRNGTEVLARYEQWKAARESDDQPQAQIEETEDTFILSNGILTATVLKAYGCVVSLKFKGEETLRQDRGMPHLWWSHTVRGAPRIETRTTIDPRDNDGRRAEVSVKGFSDGVLMGHGPGAPPEGDLAIDIEMRFALERGDSALYTYCIFDHPESYPAGDFTEARIAAVLQPFFEYIHIDDARSGKYPLLDEGIDKYVYTANQFENRSYGYSSAQRGMGWFMLIPSPEFLSGGPTRPEFLAHGTAPTVLSYWRSSHYGGAGIDLAEGEKWTRVVGPLLVYLNEGSTPGAMWEDAKGRLQREEQSWPYDWVTSPEYASRAQRANVRGQIAIDDPFAPSSAASREWILAGLTKTPYETQSRGVQRTVTWQNDAKYLQHWVRSHDPDGRFEIPAVPEGTYNLSVIAPGVPGGFFKEAIQVAAGSPVDLGKFEWHPDRDGQPIWEIGTPDRSAMEFAGADQYFRPGQALRYARQFPNDIEFVIGQSDPGSDWYYAHIPHTEDPNAEILPFRGVAGDGRAAPRTIRFTLPGPILDRAVLRIAVCGTGAQPALDCTVNGASVGRIIFGRGDGALIRHQINGFWREVKTEIDGALLVEGENTLTLTAPAGPLNSGIVYDSITLNWQ